MLGTIVGALAKAVLGMLATILGQRQTRADQIELGQRRQADATRAADNAVIRKAEDAAWTPFRARANQSSANTLAVAQPFAIRLPAFAFSCPAGCLPACRRTGGRC